MDSRNYSIRYDLTSPIQQLQIRVRLERVFSGIEHKFSNLPTLLHRESGRNLQEDRGQQRNTHVGGEREEKVFKWQEKVFSRREFLLYYNEENCQSNIQKQYHSSIIEKQHEFGDDFAKNRIFSYTEIDNDEKNDEKKFILIDKLTSHLAEKVASLRHRKVAPKKRSSVGDPVAEFPSQEAMKRARSRPKVQIMRIMAYLGDRTSATPQRQDEFVLCTLTLLNDKHLFLNPDFNGIFSPENFYKQFSLSKPYRIESSLGVFQYTIENAGDSTAARDLAKDFEDKMLIDKENKSRFYRGDLNFHMPQDGSLDVLYLCELSEAFGFEYDNLFVRYFVDLPKGWKCAEECLLSGTTQSCSSNFISGISKCLFAFPFEITLSFDVNSPENDQGVLTRWPCIYLEIGSIDWWERYRTEGYGHAVLPTRPGILNVDIPTWRILDGKQGSELRRFFLGGSLELEDLTLIRPPLNFDKPMFGRLGYQTLSSGTIKMKIQTVHHCKILAVNDRNQQMKLYEDIIHKVNNDDSDGLNSNIIRILESFQKARKRMIAIRDSVLSDVGLITS